MHVLGRANANGQEEKEEVEAKTEARAPDAADATAAELATRGHAFRSACNFRGIKQTIFSRPASRLQSNVGAPAKTSSARIFHLWHDPGGRSSHPNQSCARSAFRAAVVSAVCALSRDAALCCARRAVVGTPTTSSHRGVQPPRTQISKLSPRATLGRRESLAFFAVGTPPNLIRATSVRSATADHQHEQRHNRWGLHLGTLQRVSAAAGR
jgi:hypothetical protein